MNDRLHILANRATAEVINLHKGYKPPCEQYVAVLRVFEDVLTAALSEQRERNSAQREMMLKASSN